MRLTHGLTIHSGSTQDMEVGEFAHAQGEISASCVDGGIALSVFFDLPNRAAAGY